MDDEQIRSTSSVDPVTLPLEPSASSPVPLPVTGIQPLGGGRSRRWLWLLGGVLVAALLAGCATIAYLSQFLAASTTTDVADRAVVSVLSKRALNDYPGYTLVRTSSLANEDTGTAGTPEIDVYITLRNVKHPAFAWDAVYAAPAASATDPLSYQNSDEFFQAGVSQPADSFIVNWLKSHPSDQPFWVWESGDADASSRTYEVGYFPPGAGSDGATPVSKTTYFAYDTKSGVWTESSTTLEQPDTSRADGSLEDTGSALAVAFPGFEQVGAATTAGGAPLIVIRSRAVHSFRMAVDPIFLDPPDTTDGMVGIFANRAEGDAFIAYWAAHHPGTIVDTAWLDPDSTGDADLADITYVKTVAQVNNSPYQKDVRLRYRPKSRTWVPSK